ncbi:hypothetical protein [Rhizobium sp. PDO1-076]|uniref:hypothetical protein n=1 Tax=Rhizobium sp. PDO1-076 TaxID=1125979 RepID=UPI0005684775|nr:hypothetical protein [Rhizobium sp. PDO1-076]
MEYNPDLKALGQKRAQVSAGSVVLLSPYEIKAGQTAMSAKAPAGEALAADAQITDPIAALKRLNDALVAAGLAESVITTENTSLLVGRALIELTGLQSKSALTSRLTAREAAKSEQLQQATELRDSAIETQHATLVQSAIAITFSVVGIAAAGYSGFGTVRAASGGLKAKLDAAWDKLPGMCRTKPPRPEDGLSDAARSRAATNRSKSSETEFKDEAKASESNERSPPATQSAAADIDPPTASKAKPTDDDQPDDGADSMSAGEAGKPGKTAEQEATDAVAKKQSDVAEENRLRAFSTVAFACTGLGASIGALCAMNSTMNAKLSEADAAAYAAFSEETKSEGDVTHEFQQNLNTMITTVISFLKEVLDAKVNRFAALTRG